MQKKLRIYWRTLKFKLEQRLRIWLVKVHYSDHPMAFLALMQIEFLPVEYYIETGSWTKAVELGEKIKKECSLKEKEFEEFAEEITSLKEISKLYTLKQQIISEVNEDSVKGLTEYFNSIISKKISEFTTGKLYSSVSGD